MDNKELKKLSNIWHIEQPSADIVDRILTHATARPQEKSFMLSAQRYLIAVFSEWQTAWAYKVAGLVLCAIIGFGIGMTQHNVPIVDISSLAFGTIQGGSLL